MIDPNSKLVSTSKLATLEVTQLAVCKGLWFPMLTNLTNLALDRNIEY